LTGYNEFTEAGFRKLLKALKDGEYHFARYGENSATPHVLWRHDVDLSMHRAAKLAVIEREEGVHATYFLNPHSAFYSLLEPSITALARRIAEAGHDLALHFDDSAHAVKKWSAGQLEEAIGKERRLLESILERPIKAVSWHNPDQSNLLGFTDETVGGLINTYSEGLQRDYVYVSDSNGYWRFKSMAEVIAERHARLHLLTHPGWWTPEPMSPSERVDRCLLGRARRVRRDYDAILERGGRRNVTAHNLSSFEEDNS
jgi:peptidoglycan/xylan/chitin deacetylase (PgdA/CDA1 family)